MFFGKTCLSIRARLSDNFKEMSGRSINLCLLICLTMYIILYIFKVYSKFAFCHKRVKKQEKVDTHLFNINHIKVKKLKLSSIYTMTLNSYTNVQRLSSDAINFSVLFKLWMYSNALCTYRTCNKKSLLSNNKVLFYCLFYIILL